MIDHSKTEPLEIRTSKRLIFVFSIQAPTVVPLKWVTLSPSRHDIISECSFLIVSLVAEWITNGLVAGAVVGNHWFTWCTGHLRTLSTARWSVNVTNPKPLDLRVAGSFMTMTSASSPNVEKYSRIDSGVVCHERPPMNILPGSFGMSSPASIKICWTRGPFTNYVIHRGVITYVTDRVWDFEEVMSYALNHIHNFDSPNQFLVPKGSEHVES